MFLVTAPQGRRRPVFKKCRGGVGLRGLLRRLGIRLGVAGGAPSESGLAASSSGRGGRVVLPLGGGRGQYWLAGWGGGTACPSVL